MKRLIVSLALICCAGLIVNAARSLDSGGGDSTVQQKLMQAERDWANAMMNSDPVVIDQIEADDYAYVMGEMKGGKPGDLEQARAHAFAGTSELSEMQVRVFGNAAIVTGKCALRHAKYNGKDVSGDYLFTDVFVMRNGRWQVVASHANQVHAGM